MTPVDSRISIANLGLDRLDGQVALDDLQGQAQGLLADPLLVELEHPGASAPTVDDGEIVLAMPAWAGGAPKTLPNYPKLHSYLAEQTRPDAVKEVDLIAADLSSSTDPADAAG